MSSMKWGVRACGLCVCVLMAAGCRTKTPKFAGDGADFVDPTGMGADGAYALGGRTADGTLITDADAQFANVQFDYDSFQIADQELPKIEAVARYMRANGNVHLVAEGHCDERGSREYNLSLGEYRALAVRAHLIGLGIDGALIQTRSYGEEMPLDPGHGEASWRLNRRVEFKLYR